MLPLESLFHRLPQHGLSLSPGQWIRVQQLLRTLGREQIGEPSRLKSLLAPIIAQSPEQQARFYEVFDQWYQEAVDLPAEPPPIPEPEEPEVITRARRAWQRPLLLAGSLGLLLLLAYAFWPDEQATQAAKPVPTFTLSPRCLAVGDSLQLVNQTADTTLPFRWELGDGRRDSSQRSLTHVYASPGAYRLRLRVGAPGNDSSRSQTVFVHARGQRPRAQIDTLPEAGGERYTFRVRDAQPGWQYRWDFGGGDTATQAAVTRAMAEGQRHTIRLRVSLPGDAAGHCSDEATLLLDRRQELASLPLLTPLRMPPEAQPTRWSLYTWLGLPLLCVGLALAWLGLRRYRQRPPDRPGFARAFQPGEGPPVELPFPSQDDRLGPSPELQALAAALRQREYSERRDLDLPATLRATIAGGGFPDFRYQQQDRPVEYLALVETQGAADQQARLFGRLLELLRGEDVPVEVWYYRGDPSRCFRPGQDEELPLSRLAQLFGQHRLMVFGQGHQLLGRDGHLHARLAPLLATWGERALLTPLPVADWTRREQRLRDFFVLLPADLAGQLDLLAAWDERDPPSFRELQRRLLRQRPAETALLDYDLDQVEEIREFLGEDRFRWLAALALYPRPVWELTLGMGGVSTSQGAVDSLASTQIEDSGETGRTQRVRRGRKENISAQPLGELRASSAPSALKNQQSRLAYDDVLALTRLPWFRDGDLRPELRAALIDRLDPVTEQAARQRLLELLEQAEVPPNSHAAQEQQLQQEIQRLMLAPAEPQAQAGLRLLLAQGLLDPATRARVRAQVERQAQAERNTRRRGLLGALLASLLGLLLLWQLAPQGRLGGLAQPGTDSLAWYLDSAAALIEAEQYPPAEPLLAAAGRLAGLDDPWVTYLATLKQYRQARVAYAQRDWLAAEAGLSSALNRLRRVGPWPEALAAAADSNDDHFTHAQGLLAYYQDSLERAEEIRDELDPAFFDRQPSPHLLSLLGGAALERQIADRLARADSLYDFMQIAGSDEPEGQLSGWEQVATAYQAVLDLDEGNLRAQQRLAELAAVMAGLREGLGEPNASPLTGILRQARTGAPLRNVTLRWPQGETTTGSDGAFSLEVPATAGSSLRLQASYPGFRPLDTLVYLPVAGPLALSLQPQAFAPFSLSGQVQDAAGQPLAGAELRFKGQAVATTDAQGRFAFDYQPDSEVDTRGRLAVTAPGYEPSEELVELPLSEPLRVRLEKEDIPVEVPKMVRIPGGSFIMGSPEGEGESRERPEHRVTVSDFYLGETEVTNAQFAAFLNAKGNQEEGDSGWYNEKGSGYNGYAEAAIQPDDQGVWQVKPDRADHPVNYVSWYGARAYCQWLSETTGQRYRLPTEAEWEYAAGGGRVDRDTADKRKYEFAGDEDLDAVGWYTGNTNDTGTRPVAQKKPNGLGLYDMSGNVWEWCSDWFGDYPSEAQVDPKGPASRSNRVLRGGSWNRSAEDCRTAYRNFTFPDFRSNFLGFRLVRVP